MFVASLLLLACVQTLRAESWHGIEPLKSRRADVERELGKPLQPQAGLNDTLHFKVVGGEVTITFVTARFVATKKLSPETEGTVLEIVLQHEHSTDTPESLGLASNSKFVRDGKDEIAVYRNLKDGLIYTFIGGKLKTTRYSPSTEQLVRARKGT